MTPLVILDVLGKVDIECTVSGSGPSAQAGAVRLVISKCLAPFQTESVREGMRQGRIDYRDKIVIKIKNFAILLMNNSLIINSAYYYISSNISMIAYIIQVQKSKLANIFIP